jgi:hypothetical protein
VSTKASPSVLPDAALNQHLAVLGKTGSGKTYAAKGIVERLLDDQRQVCVLDPTGAWWGLRLAADGKGRGYNVVLIGGKHADIPLHERSGAAVARLVTEQHASVVLDTSGLTVGEYTRWFIDFAGTLYTTIREPLHLVIDEAHYFMPQGRVPDVDAGKMLHAGNRLMSGGRSLGIRGLLITQRPAKLHKDALTCADSLIAMRVIAPQDRAAIKEWVDGCGNPGDGKAVLDSLASLKKGEGWVWYPEGTYLQRVTFPPIKTYDSSATPKHGARSSPAVGEIDLGEVRKALADAVAEAEANDPKLLRQKLAAAQAELRKALSTPVSVNTEEVAELRVRLAAETGRADALERTLAAVRTAVGAPVPPTVTAPPAPRRIAPITTNGHPPKPPAKAAAGLTGAQQRVLDALAMWATIGEDSPSVAQVAFVARINPQGGHFSNTVGPLSSGEYISRERDGYMSLTDLGRRAANWPTGAASLAEYHDNIRALLKTGAQRKVFDAVVSAGGQTTVEAIGAATGIDPNGGHFSNSIGPLSTLGLIERSRGYVTPTELVFPRGLA